MQLLEKFFNQNIVDESTTHNILKDIITPELIHKISDFADKYEITINCSDIGDDVVIIKKATPFSRYRDLVGKSGKHEVKSNKIILVEPHITQRLFLHEYVHKKSLNENNYGIIKTNEYWALNEVITEKITCEILCIPPREQINHPYFSAFPAIEMLKKAIPWKIIVQSYFHNKTIIYEDFFKEDITPFLDTTADLLMCNICTNIENEKIKLYYDLSKSKLQDIINKHYNL